MQKDWLRNKVRGGGETEGMECVRRILQLINVTGAQTRVEMEKNLQVRARLGEIWTVQTR